MGHKREGRGASEMVGKVQSRTHGGGAAVKLSVLLGGEELH